MLHGSSDADEFESPGGSYPQLTTEGHEWIFPLAAWRPTHGDEGGEVSASSGIVRRTTCPYSY